jgi:hypothetical protein
MDNKIELLEKIKKLLENEDKEPNSTIQIKIINLVLEELKK